MKLAVVVGMAVAVITMLLVGTPLSGAWSGSLINTTSGGSTPVGLKIAVQERPGQFPALSGQLVYFRNVRTDRGWRKELTGRQFPITGSWIKDSGEIHLSWQEEEVLFSFNCRIRGLLSDLLRCQGEDGGGRPYELKLHRALGWLGL